MGPILVGLHILVSFFLILVVLLQPGKGVDLSAFGGGSSQTFFGARGATSLFTKLTVGAAVLFLSTSLTLSILSTGGTRTVLDSAAPAPVEPLEAEEAGGLELPDAPYEVTDAPYEVTDVPYEVTDAPYEATDVPFEVTDVPFEVTDVPFEVTEPTLQEGEAEGEAGDEGAETP